MEEGKIRKYAGLMRELGLTGFEISENGTTVRLERNARTKEAALPVEANETDKPAAPSGIYELRSPMVGVFYTSPTESEEPFVRVGDAVRRGDVLCIIEAMKLMNEIVAERDGTVTEICVKNGQTVDFGKALFRFGEERS